MNGKMIDNPVSAGRSVLITGAASGLGTHLALEAATRGYRVWLVDVNPRVALLSERLNGQCLVVDLGEALAARTIYEWAPEVDIVINNAGVATRGQFHVLDPSRIEGILAVNVFAPVMLSYAYLKRFVSRGSGVLVNISSSACYFPTPGLGPYGPSKSFLTAFTEGLIAEYDQCPGIHVIGILPSGINTSFQESSGIRKYPHENLLNPAWLARSIWNDIENGRSMLRCYGWTTRIFRILRCCLPHVAYIRLISRMLGKFR